MSVKTVDLPDYLRRTFHLLQTHTYQVIVPEGSSGKFQQGGNFEALHPQLGLGHDPAVGVGFIVVEARAALLTVEELEEAVFQLEPLL